MPVPKVYHLCKDESIIGRQFYLMSYLDGRKFEDVRMPEVETKEEREALYVLFPPPSASCLSVLRFLVNFVVSAG